MSAQIIMPSLLIFLPMAVNLSRPNYVLSVKKVTRANKPVFPNTNNMHTYLPSLTRSVPKPPTQNSTPNGCALHQDPSLLKHQASNASHQRIEKASIRDLILSNKNHVYSFQTNFRNKPQISNPISDSAAHSSDRSLVRVPRIPKLIRSLSYLVQPTGIPHLQGNNFYHNKATDNPLLLREYLSMMKSRYHRQVLSQNPPRIGMQVPLVSLYWNPQILPKDRNRHRQHLRRVIQHASPKHFSSNKRPYAFQPVHLKYRAWPRHRAIHKESFITNDDTLPGIYGKNPNKNINRWHENNSFHSRHSITTPNLYRDRPDKRTPYRERYLQNLHFQPERLRKDGHNDHLGRINTQRLRQQMFFPWPHDQIRQTLHRIPKFFSDPTSYRERYLKMLHDRQVEAQRKISRPQRRENSLSFPWFTPPIRKQRPKPQSSPQIYNRRTRPLGNKQIRFLYGDKSESERYKNHHRLEYPHRRFETNLDRSMELRDRPQHQYVDPWLFKPDSLQRPDQYNKTIHQSRAPLKTMDWRTMENSCWHYNGFYKHSRWCKEMIRKLQRKMVAPEKPQPWRNHLPYTTSSSPPRRLEPLVTTTATPEMGVWMTAMTTSSMDLTTTLAPPIMSTVAIGDREFNTKAPGVKEWLKERCGVTSSPFIIGGHNSRQGRWAWQASLQIVTSALPWHRCGGVLIHPRWILTAAHCVEGPFYGDLTNWRVVLADHNLDIVSGDEVYRKITRIISHPGYIQTSNFPNDVALLELDSPVDVTSGHIQVACLPDDNFDLSPGTECWISGWGETRGSGGREGQMNELKLRIIDTGQCRAMWDRVDISVLDTQVCLGDGITGACFGDSGGPLMCERDGRVVVAGVMSWLVRNCSGPDFPNVFTRLPSYLDWLDQQLDFYQAGWSS